MKTTLLFGLLLTGTTGFTQKTVQQLQPVRLSIFKNGTYFVKKEATVNVENGSFVIPAPTNVLMGTYWLAAGKNAILKSIVVKEDTFKVEKKAASISQYLQSNVNSNIVISRSTNTGARFDIAGLLIEYNPISMVAKIKIADKRIIVIKMEETDVVYFPEQAGNKYAYDSIAQLAKISVSMQQGKTLASTYSLEKGIRWYPSYLLSIINEKDAKLEMKATIVNGEEDFKNTSIDIIIGNPEMFFGQELDPVAVSHLGQVFAFDNYGNNVATQRLTNSNAVYNGTYSNSDNISLLEPDKDGAKMGDLYFYQLGNLDLEKNARVIVPVLTANVTYEDVYAAYLPANSPSSDETKVQDVFHRYLVKNTGTAPFTTGAVLVMNDKQLPMAQAQMKYTPPGGVAEVNLSKAIDVQVKNEETETKREPKARKIDSDTYYDKVQYSGRISIVNYQAKKIKLKLIKEVTGEVSAVSDQGTAGKIKDNNGRVNPSTVIRWEVELAPNERKVLTYTYSGFVE